MTRASPRVHRYAGNEFMLAYGPKDGPQILVLQPLFEEMNRCRAVIAGVCRTLAAQSIGCWLPDLPGTGESLRGLETIAWSDWPAAVTAAIATVRDETDRIPSTVAIRGGALLDRSSEMPAWRLAPTGGRSLLSDLRRAALASGSDPEHPAGYTLPTALADHLSGAEPSAGGKIRSVRLTSDDRPADDRIDGVPIWRRPEPFFDAATVAMIADDIACWTKP